MEAEQMADLPAPPQTVLLTVARAAFPTGETAISFEGISPSVGSLCMGISACLL